MKLIRCRHQCLHGQDICFDWPKTEVKTTTKTPTSSHYAPYQSQSLISFVIVFTITVPDGRIFATRTRFKVHAPNKLPRNAILTPGMCDSATATAQTTLAAAHSQIIRHGILSYHNVCPPSCCSAVVPSTAPPAPLHIDAIHILCHNQHLCDAQKSRASILLSYICCCTKATWHRLTWFTF